MIDIKPSPSAPGSFRVSMPIPDDVSQRFDTATLARLGVKIESGRATLTYLQSTGGELSLDRQFPVNSYGGRFEGTMDSASFADIMAERNRQLGPSRIQTPGNGKQSDITKDIEKSKNTGMEAPQVSTEGPKLPERDDSEIAGFPSETKEMKRNRAQFGAKPAPQLKPLQQVFPVPPMKPVVHAPPRPMDSPPPSYSAPRMK